MDETTSTASENEHNMNITDFLEEAAVHARLKYEAGMDTFDNNY